MGVGDDRADGRVHGELARQVQKPDHFRLAGDHLILFAAEQAGQLAGGIHLKHVADGVDRDDGADLEVAHLHRIAAQTGFHRPVIAHQLADGSARARADVAAALEVALAVPAGSVAHRGVRAHLAAHAAEVEYAGADDDGDDGVADLDAPALFLQVLHHAAGCVEAVGAAAGEEHRVDAVVAHQRVEQLVFARGRAAAAHIHAADGLFVADDHGAAGGVRVILRMPDVYAGDGAQADFLVWVHGFLHSGRERMSILRSSFTTGAAWMLNDLPVLASIKARKSSADLPSSSLGIM